MLNEKKISKSGSVTIPSHIRRQFGIVSDEKVKIEMVNNGQILLTRIVGSCIICGSNDKLQKIDDKYICKSCIEKVNNIGTKENDK